MEWAERVRILSFYHLDGEGNVKSLPEDASKSFMQRPSGTAQNTTNNTAPLTFVDKDRTIITSEHIPQGIIGTPLSHSVLCFWSSVCHGTVEYDESGAVVFHQKKSSIELTDIRPITDEDLSGPAGLVVVGAGGRHGDINFRLQILWVKWDRRVASRCGTWDVLEFEWKKQEIVWQPVCLG
jgi:hypothetical protein